MIDADTLILAVENHPCLWDIHDKTYHDKDMRLSAWEQVCREVITDWDSCTEDSKEIKSADIKKKWTHIRDYFRRHFKKLRKYQNHSMSSGSAPKKVRKYIYADLLHFLTPVFDKRISEGKYRNNDSDASLEQESETKEEHDEEPENDSTDMNIPSPISTPIAHNSSQDKKYQIPMHVENQQKVNQTRQEEMDDDTNFLLSFRTHMKNMNESKKIDFKLGMLKLLKKINTECYSRPQPPVDFDSDN